MNEGKIREILSEILADDLAENVTKSILGSGKADENVIMELLPEVLSENIKSDLASKVIYEINKEKPIMMKTVITHLPDILDEEARAKISKDIVEKVSKCSSISADEIAEILPEILSKRTKNKVAKAIFESVKRMRARRISVTDVSQIKVSDISEDNVYRIGKLDGMVARKQKNGVWAFGYDGDSELGKLLYQKMKIGNPKMYTVVFKSAMSEDRFYLFSDVFGAAERVYDDNYKKGLFKEFEFNSEVRIKITSEGIVSVSRNGGPYTEAGYVSSNGAFVSMYEIPCN